MNLDFKYKALESDHAEKAHIQKVQLVRPESMWGRRGFGKVYILKMTVNDKEIAVRLKLEHKKFFGRAAAMQNKVTDFKKELTTKLKEAGIGNLGDLNTEELIAVWSQLNEKAVGSFLENSELVDRLNHLLEQLNSEKKDIEGRIHDIDQNFEKGDLEEQEQWQKEREVLKEGLSGIIADLKTSKNHLAELNKSKKGLEDQSNACILAFAKTLDYLQLNKPEGVEGGLPTYVSMKKRLEAPDLLRFNQIDEEKFKEALHYLTPADIELLNESIGKQKEDAGALMENQEEAAKFARQIKSDQAKIEASAMELSELQEKHFSPNAALNSRLERIEKNKAEMKVLLSKREKPAERRSKLEEIKTRFPPDIAAQLKKEREALVEELGRLGSKPAPLKKEDSNLDWSKIWGKAKEFERALGMAKEKLTTLITPQESLQGRIAALDQQIALHEKLEKRLKTTERNLLYIDSRVRQLDKENAQLDDESRAELLKTKKRMKELRKGEDPEYSASRAGWMARHAEEDNRAFFLSHAAAKSALEKKPRTEEIERVIKFLDHEMLAVDLIAEQIQNLSIVEPQDRLLLLELGDKLKANDFYGAEKLLKELGGETLKEQFVSLDNLAFTLADFQRFEAILKRKAEKALAHAEEGKRLKLEELGTAGQYALNVFDAMSVYIDEVTNAMELFRSPQEITNELKVLEEGKENAEEIAQGLKEAEMEILKQDSIEKSDKEQLYDILLKWASFEMVEEKIDDLKEELALATELQQVGRQSGSIRREINVKKSEVQEKTKEIGQRQNEILLKHYKTPEGAANALKFLDDSAKKASISQKVQAAKDAMILGKIDPNSYENKHTLHQLARTSSRAWEMEKRHVVELLQELAPMKDGIKKLQKEIEALEEKEPESEKKTSQKLVQIRDLYIDQRVESHTKVLERMKGNLEEIYRKTEVYAKFEASEGHEYEKIETPEISRHQYKQFADLMIKALKDSGLSKIGAKERELHNHEVHLTIDQTHLDEKRADIAATKMRIFGHPEAPIPDDYTEKLEGYQRALTEVQKLCIAPLKG